MWLGGTVAPVEAALAIVIFSDVEKPASSLCQSNHSSTNSEDSTHTTLVGMTVVPIRVNGMCFVLSWLHTTRTGQPDYRVLSKDEPDG